MSMNRGDKLLITFQHFIGQGQDFNFVAVHGEDNDYVKRDEDDDNSFGDTFGHEDDDL